MFGDEGNPEKNVYEYSRAFRRLISNLNVSAALPQKKR